MINLIRQENGLKSHYEDIYLIYDPTTFGACNKGFVICSTGIYLKEEKIVILKKCYGININTQRLNIVQYKG